MKVEVAVLGSPSLTVLMVDPIPNKPYGFCGRKVTLKWNSDLRRCVKIEVAIHGSPSVIEWFLWM